MGHSKNLTPAQLAAAGWRPLPRSGLYGRDYEHASGWRIEHCGHPTALWPYLLLDPAGEIVLIGAGGPWRNPTFGTAWSTVSQAVEYVTQIGLTRAELLKICRWR